MDVACDYDSASLIELCSKQKQEELETMKRGAMGAKIFSPLFSTQKAFSFGTQSAPLENEWKPKFLHFCKESARLKTFATWPKQMRPKPEELAKCGFFYEGVSDTCRCFFCGLLVHNWETDDDPIEEHFRHKPSCHFVEFLM